MRWRGADSPRSASPIGPAPTPLPRMALPPATNPAPCSSRDPSWVLSAPSEVVLEHQALGNDRGEPDDAGEDRQAIQVLLHHRRTRQRRGDAAAEQVTQAAAL